MHIQKWLLLPGYLCELVRWAYGISRVFRRVATFRKTCRVGCVQQHSSHFIEVFLEGVMPRILEVLLWSAALATWLMLFFVLIGECLKPLSKSIRRIVQGTLRVKGK